MSHCTRCNKPMKILFTSFYCDCESNNKSPNSVFTAHCPGCTRCILDLHSFLPDEVVISYDMAVFKEYENSYNIIQAANTAVCTCKFCKYKIYTGSIIDSYFKAKVNSDKSFYQKQCSCDGTTQISSDKFPIKRQYAQIRSPGNYIIFYKAQFDLFCYYCEHCNQTYDLLGVK